MIVCCFDVPAATDAASSDASWYHASTVCSMLMQRTLQHAHAACISPIGEATDMGLTCCKCVGLQPFTVAGRHVSFWPLSKCSPEPFLRGYELLQS